MRAVRIVNFGITVKIRYNSLSMIRVKICGTTNLEDALAAVEAGADALGFVFYAKSPRAVSRKTAAAIIARLPEAITAVGVFVDEDLTVVRETMNECGLRIAQLHGAEGPAYCANLGHSVIKAVRLRNFLDESAIADYPVGTFSPAAFNTGLPDGT